MRKIEQKIKILMGFKKYKYIQKKLIDYSTVKF